MVQAGPNLNDAYTTAHGRILASIQAGSGDTTVYTVPSGRSATVTQGTACNTGAGSVAVSVSVIPAGASVDSTHRAVSGYPLAPGDTLPLRNYIAEMRLGPGDVISVNCSLSAAVDVLLSGIEYT